MNRVAVILIVIILASFGACDYSFNINCHEEPYLVKFQDTMWYPAQQEKLSFVLLDSGRIDTIKLLKKLKVFDIYNKSEEDCPLYYEAMRCRFFDVEHKTEIIYEYSQYDPSLRVSLNLQNRNYHFTVENYKKQKETKYYRNRNTWDQSAAIHHDSGLVRFNYKHLTLKLIQ